MPGPSRAYDRGYDPDGRRSASWSPSSRRRPRAEALADLEVPTLVIHGAHDPLVDVSGGERDRRADPGRRAARHRRHGPRPARQGHGVGPAARRRHRPAARAATTADRHTQGELVMGPLAGVKVVELAGIGPGPFAAMLLADMGAEVVRIDRAGRRHGGDPADPPLGPARTAAARSIGVDLKNPDGVETVLRLVEEADALIEGFRPGVMERLGLGPDVCLGPQPEARLRPHDRLGPGRPVRARPPATTSTTSPSPARSTPIGRAGEPPDAAAQPRRRLRRRRHAARLRRRLRAARGAAVGQGPGRRRRHGRRRRAR